MQASNLYFNKVAVYMHYTIDNHECLEKVIYMYTYMYMYIYISAGFHNGECR